MKKVYEKPEIKFVSLITQEPITDDNDTELITGSAKIEDDIF